MEHMLRKADPGFPWNFTPKEPKPRGFWKDKRNMLKALEKAEGQIGIKTVRKLPHGCGETDILFHRSLRIGIPFQWLI